MSNELAGREPDLKEGHPVLCGHGRQKVCVCFFVFSQGMRKGIFQPFSRHQVAGDLCTPGVLVRGLHGFLRETFQTVNIKELNLSCARPQHFWSMCT